MRVRAGARWAVAGLFMGSVLLAVTRPAAEQSKIDWLLAQVDESGAIFIRNGKEYDAKKAVSHLKTKLFFAGKRVQTARAFIVGCASHSEETGKPYEMRFPDGKQVRLGDWLMERLQALEKGRTESAPGSAPPPTSAPKPKS